MPYHFRATACKSEHRRLGSSRLIGCASIVTVKYCPENLYPRGNRFTLGVVRAGLREENWPSGMQFETRGGKVLTVIYGHLVNEQGGLEA